MKSLNKIILASVGFVLTLSSCKYEDKFDAVEPNSNHITLSDTTKATFTCKELKDKYINNSKYQLTDNSHNATYAKMFNVSEIPAGDSAIIRGVVVSTDVDGNTYKKIVIRDEKDSTGLDISVDASGLSAVWPQGQRVVINTSGLHIGEYANFPAVGYQTFNRDRNRYEVGRLPYYIAKDHIHAIGMPDTLLAQPEVATIADILANKEYYYSRLVKIRDVRFGAYYEDAACTSISYFEQNYYKLIDDMDGDEIPFSEENTLNVPVSRVVIDKDGNKTNISTSFYSKFTNKSLKLVL